MLPANFLFFVLIGVLTIIFLQILNLEGNKLSILPTSIENLQHLQTLNLKGIFEKQTKIVRNCKYSRVLCNICVKL